MNSKTNKYYRTKRLFAVIMVVFWMPFMVLAQQANNALMERGVASGLDEAQLERVLDRANERGIEQGDLSRLLEPAFGLAERDLPSDYILQKLMEGFAKGVPPGRIMPLINSIQENTPRAVSIASNWTEKPEVAIFIERSGEQGPQFRNELVRANLKSLTQQIEPEILESVLEGMGQRSVLDKTTPRSIIAAVGILPDLPASARQADAARPLLARAVEGGFSASDLQKLPGAMNSAEKRSQLPAASVVEGVAQQLGNGIPASQVLQNLFNGNVNPGPPANIPGRPNNGPGRPPGTDGNN
ncbi:MAG: hypothetical protein WD381_06005 [Balneolaceae bacterium]